MLWLHIHKTAPCISNSPTMVVHPIRKAKGRLQKDFGFNVMRSHRLSFALARCMLYMQMREERQAVPQCTRRIVRAKLNGFRERACFME